MIFKFRLFITQGKRLTFRIIMTTFQQMNYVQITFSVATLHHCYSRLNNICWTYDFCSFLLLLLSGKGTLTTT